jgi:hypothetical protein
MVPIMGLDVATSSLLLPHPERSTFGLGGRNHSRDLESRFTATIGQECLRRAGCPVVLESNLVRGRAPTSRNAEIVSS